MATKPMAKYSIKFGEDRSFVSRALPYRFSLTPGNDYTLGAAFDETSVRTPPLVTFKAVPGATLHLNTGNLRHRGGD